MQLTHYNSGRERARRRKETKVFPLSRRPTEEGEKVLEHIKTTGIWPLYVCVDSGEGSSCAGGGGDRGGGGTTETELVTGPSLPTLP